MSHNQLNVQKITWNKISDYEQLLFGVWARDEPNQWVKRAWYALEKEGLTEYGDESEKQYILLRLLTLATFYHEFCGLAFDMYVDRESLTLEWIQQGVANRLQLWSLNEVQTRYNREDFDDPYDGIVEFVCDLIDGLRAIVYNAMVQEFDSDYELFKAMLMSCYDQNFTDDELQSWQEMTVDDLDANEERAFYWICIGMPRSTEGNF